MFDTSASQTGVYRDDALAMLDALLAEWGDDVRVKLTAIDVYPVALTEDFVAADSDAMKAAIVQLNRRAPLGSTDMGLALQDAAASFPQDTGRARSIVYIGDGLSRVNLLQTDEFRAVIDALVAARISVSSFAIGPQRDFVLLAALANHTGGSLFIDSNEHSSQEAGTTVARLATTSVVWPTEVTLPKDFAEVFPAELPPIRSDRASVLVGTLLKGGEQQIKLSGVCNGQQVDWAWTVAAETSSDDNSYLPQLITVARNDAGLTLPTVGEQGLIAVRQMVQQGARNVAELSSRALASGDRDGALRLSKAALDIDPSTTTAETVLDAARGANGPPGERGEPAVRLAAYQAPAEDGGALDEFLADEGAFLQEVEDQKRVQTQIVQAEVERGLTHAREMFDVDPQGAIAELKTLLTNIERAPDLEGEIRAQLRDQIVSSIKEGQRQQIVKDERDQIIAERRAAAREQARLVREAERREEKVKQIVARFNSLMDEGRYREAEEAAYEARDLDHDDPAITAAVWTSRMTGYVRDIMSVREARHKGVVDALFQVEKAHVPFADEPPITYPDPQVWEELTLRRKKYASIDLAKRGGSEEKIFQALNDSTTLEFIETPLADVVDYLKDLHGIEIQIDHRALEDVGIGSDTPITRNLKGITLRSALRLMLKEMDLTYVVRDEVLLITTPEEAESELTTKVYPVADLVLPISSGAGANPFQLGGGLGGRGGFGGGLGGGGGGMGGGGFGGGGFGGGGLGGGLGGGGGFGGGGLGGGVFFVEDEIRLGSKNADSQPSEEPAAAPAPATFRPMPASASPTKGKPQGKAQKEAQCIELKIADGQDVQDAWDAHFRAAQANPESPADVRQTVRVLMTDGKYDQVVAVIRAALKHGQPQPWMYEAIYLALEADGASQQEMERALLSAVDFSDNIFDLMYVAAYMSRLGNVEMDKRALKLFEEVARVHPAQPEPYINALEIADRIGDQDAARWAALGVLRQSWPSAQRGLEDKANYVAVAALQQLEKDGKQEEAERFRNELNHAMIRDVRVEVRWTGDADVDVLIEEPSGTICSFRNPRTTAGGVMLGDTAARSGAASVDGYSETYICPEGFAGNYRMLLRRVWGKVTSGRVTVDIYTNYKTKQQEHLHREIPLSEKDAVVIFDLEKGRRQEALAEHKIANAARTQLAVSRAVLAQQLNTVTDSTAARDFAALPPPGRPRWPAAAARPPQRRLSAGDFDAPRRYEHDLDGGDFGRPAVRADYGRAAVLGDRRSEHVQLLDRQQQSATGHDGRCASGHDGYRPAPAAPLPRLNGFLGLSLNYIVAAENTRQRHFHAPPWRQVARLPEQNSRHLPALYS